MAYHLKHNPEKWPYPARILCVDHGTKTLGLAICNAEQTVVTPMHTIHRKKWEQDKQNLASLMQSESINTVLFGYPLNMDGSKGPRCQSVTDFVILMEETWPDTQFFFFDERLSTQTVDKSLDKDMSKSRQKRKIFKDAMAAQVILEEALWWIKNNA